MRMVIVVIVVMRMAMVTPGGSFAEPTVRTDMVAICRVIQSASHLCIWPEEWKTDNGLSVLGRLT